METKTKSIWTGSITFGLINIPIKLFSAVKESNIEMNMLDKSDHSNIKFKRVNENTGKEVVFADIVKGYKLDDQYVVVDDSDFEAAEAEKTKTIDLMNFVDEKEIDSIYYEQPYYLEPDKGAMKAYALLRDALQSSGKVGVGTFVLRNKESLVILKSYKNVIVLNRIRFQEEIRNTTELKLPPISETNTKEMDMAIKLVDQLTEKFDIANYKDDYTEKLLKIIKDKAKGKKQAVPKLKVVHKQSDDLMTMLKASLENKESKSS
ncbi:MAG: Ku protein [Flavobacterium sp.]